MAAVTRRVLVTGSSGLIGSEAVAHFDRQGDHVLGIDNNMRADFFGPSGDTTWNLSRLREQTRHFEHHSLDIRDRAAVLAFVAEHRPQMIIHCAAQPSHDLAKDRPFDDFDVNAGGTLNLLEAARRHTPESPFVFLSTNKVYGDAPNEIPLVELERRYEYANASDHRGVSESCRIDQSLHSLFGASKVAADVMTQEYGRYFGLPTVCFRCGCLTGSHHSGVELHGFLSYLVKVAARGETYTIYGYKGKQVRDQIHGCDVVAAIEAFALAPRPGEVYNLGGGRSSNASVLECLDKLEARLGRPVPTRYVETNRKGDHICYISDITKFMNHYPGWNLTRTVDDIIDEILSFERATSSHRQAPAEMTLRSGS
jgi:CDP-paratose 2-epimerase